MGRDPERWPDRLADVSTVFDGSLVAAICNDHGTLK